MVTHDRKPHVKKEKARSERIQSMVSIRGGFGPELQRSSRKAGTLESRQKFLIVCEGKKSEPNYFNWLQRRWRVNADVKIIGAAGNPEGVVKHAIEYKNPPSGSHAYDQVWAVFDKDDFSDECIHKAFNLAEQERIHLAFSNESFELWYLLHFNFRDTPIGRVELCQKLTENLGRKYEKNECEPFSIISHLLLNAMRHASKLAQINGEKCANPYTGVYLLVAEFAKYAANNEIIKKETQKIRETISPQ